MIVARLALGAAAAWAAYAWGAHLLTSGCVWRGPSTGRRIALTFDDGPDAAWTERTLAVLDRTKSAATAGRTGASGSAGRAAPRTRSAALIACSPTRSAVRFATSVRPGAW